jgi:hypothetical protein
MGVNLANRKFVNLLTDSRRKSGYCFLMRSTDSSTSSRFQDGTDELALFNSESKILQQILGVIGYFCLLLAFRRAPLIGDLVVMNFAT